MWKQLGFYLGPPLLAVLSIFTFQTAHAANQQQKAAIKQQAVGQAQERQAAQNDQEARQHATLEVLGLGLAVSKFRQARVWEEIEKKSRDFVLPTDPKEYPWGRRDKEHVSSKREADTLEHAASWFVEKWTIPVFVAGPANHNPKMQDFLEAVVASARTNGGMHWHEFQVIEMMYDDHPERLVTQVFEFFDKNPRVPAVVLFGEDGLVLRDTLSVRGGPRLLTDGDFKKSDPTEAMAAFVLVRRDLVDALRPYAFDAKTGKPAGPAPAHPFQPSPWLPQPWTTHQLDQFDKLPTLGYLHRPQTVSYLDPHGKPLHNAARSEAFRRGWLAAVQSLPPESRVARVFYDHGSTDLGKHIAPLAQTLSTESHLDILEPGQGFNLTTNLGDIGAASPFVQLALGIIASYRHDDISASVNLKRNDGASIVLITPPQQKKRHPGGSDPLHFGLVPETK